jgi:polysaccharide chain length determinant protein (PEP-CTERM system associated)
MVRNGEMTLEDVRRVFRRFWWIAPISAIVCVAAAIFVATLLPKKYTSQTSVLVDEPTVPVSYVAPVISESSNRLASIQQQILSGPNLQVVVDKFGLYPEERGKVPTAALVDRLKEAITVAPLQAMAGTGNSLPGFHVSVKFGNPQMAHDICAEVTSMFLDQNARVREHIGKETTGFLSQQLAQAKQNLDQQDAALADFKRQHLGSLPEEETANLQMLSGLNTQLDAASQNINRSQQDKAYLQTLLDQQEGNWKLAHTGGQNPETLEEQLTALQDQLAVALNRYTPEHPDIIKLKSQIEDVKKRMAEAAPTPSAVPAWASHEPAQLAQLRLKIKQDNQMIADLTKRQTQVEEQIRVLQGRVQSSPVIEQQFKELTRNYDTALEGYKDLLRKQESSAMAGALEHQQEGEQFRVLEPPSLPTEPSFPKKPLFAGGGLGAGLALSAGLMYLIALGDKSMHSERDVEVCLKLPVLTTVPNLDIAALNKLARRQKSSDHAVVFEA